MSDDGIRFAVKGEMVDENVLQETLDALRVTRPDRYDRLLASIQVVRRAAVAS